MMVVSQVSRDNFNRKRLFDMEEAQFKDRDIFGNLNPQRSPKSSPPAK